MAKVFIEESTLTAIGDAIRDKEGSTELIPTTDMADRIGAIETGVEIDPDKILPTTVTGDGFVHLDDVSEIPHDITIQAAEGTKVTVVRNNLWQEATSIEITTYEDITLNMPDLTGVANLGMSAEIMGNEGTEYYLVKLYDANSNAIESPFLRLYPQGNGKYRTTSTFTVSGKPTRARLYSGSSFANCENVTTNWSKIQFFESAMEEEVIAPTTIKSNSPYMDFITDTSLTIGYNKSWGMQTEYDRFWDAFQDYGKLSSYEYAFNAKRWNDKSFKPKYNIVCTGQYGAGATFRQCVITNLAKSLEKQGVLLDFSQATVMQNTFQQSSIEVIPDIDLSMTTKMNATFSNAKKLKTVSISNLQDSCTFENNPFYMCSALENLSISGTIAKSGMDLQWSTKLSRASIESVVNALASDLELELTLSQTAVNNAFPDYAEWEELMNSKPHSAIYLV